MRQLARIREYRFATGIAASLSLLAMFAVAGCGSGDDGPGTLSIPGPQREDASLDGLPDADAIIADPTQLPKPTVRKNLHPSVLIRTSLGDITVTLDAEKAPETVDNFLSNYVQRDFYDGTIFHHVEPGFIAVAGGYSEDQELKPARAPIRNEADNGLKNLKGTLAMSRQPGYVDSATSQFFFNLGDNPELDYDAEAGDEGYGYCVFGKVTEGQEVLDKIAATPTESRGDFPLLPAETILIRDVEVID